MCGRHWNRVSRKTQRIIWETVGDPSTHDLYVEAVSSAMLEVARKEEYSIAEIETYMNGHLFLIHARQAASSEKT